MSVRDMSPANKERALQAQLPWFVGWMFTMAEWFKEGEKMLDLMRWELNNMQERLDSSPVQ